jgi:hypothetical protein
MAPGRIEDRVRGFGRRTPTERLSPDVLVRADVMAEIKAAAVRRLPIRMPSRERKRLSDPCDQIVGFRR